MERVTKTTGPGPVSGDGPDDVIGRGVRERGREWETPNKRTSSVSRRKYRLQFSEGTGLRR